MILACSKTSVQKPTTENRTQNWPWNSCLDVIAKQMWSLNLPELNPMGYWVWGNARGLSQAPSKTEDIRAELKEMLQMTVSQTIDRTTEACVTKGLDAVYCRHQFPLGSPNVSTVPILRNDQWFLGHPVYTSAEIQTQWRLRFLLAVHVYHVCYSLRLVYAAGIVIGRMHICRLQLNDLAALSPYGCANRATYIG